MIKTKTARKKWPKMDRYLISSEPWEREWVVLKFAKLGIRVWRPEVDKAIRTVGRSRQKVYNYLLKLHGQ